MTHPSTLSHDRSPPRSQTTTPGAVTPYAEPNVITHDTVVARAARMRRRSWPTGGRSARPAQQRGFAVSTGALSVFLVKGDSALYRYSYSQSLPSYRYKQWLLANRYLWLLGNTWQPAKSMGGSWMDPGVMPTVIRNENGALSVFLIGDDSALYRYDQQVPNGEWVLAGSMGGSSTRPDVT